MAKWKAARGKKQPARPNLQAVPCLLLVVMVAILLALLFFATLRSAG